MDITQYYFDAFPLRPPLQPFESFTSYLTRVAEANGIRKDLQLKPFFGEYFSIAQFSDYAPRSFGMVPAITNLKESELARQLGYSPSLIWHHFTDLCKRISARYLAQKRKQREERVRAVCEEIRQVVLLLHKQGIYPGAKQVSLLLKNRHNIRTIEGHEAWRLMLAELGYPTDALKRYSQG